ncbi:MAG TPA: hypothetical protein VL749_04010 [Patescibacteria group bacterium]|nr:hypothetical protein [Patescibacteria group bacterium]
MRMKARLVRATTIVLAATVLVLVGSWAAVAIEDRNETARTTARFEPPVWAGQNFIVECAGGFYARHESTIVLVISAHCGNPGLTLRDADGQVIGVIGPRAQLADCPEGRFCAPSDIMTLALAPGRIPWGHLNMVDLGAGGYRTIDSGTRPLACPDIAVGDRFEIDGREHYRSGTVIAIEPYENATDTMFPCIIVGDRTVSSGDSGAAVLVRGLPAGIIARQLDGRVGFTPLAEGLDNLALTLCTTPDCDLSPARAVQP